MASSNHAKYAFLYLLAFFTLFFVVLGAGQILFQIINIQLPISDSYNGGGLDTLRFGLSSMLVAAPIFYFTTRSINSGIAAGDYSLDAGVRRWLTYAILLIAAGTGIGDLIFAFTSYLGGEMTLRVGLKVLVILALAGSVLGYYGHDICRAETKRTTLMTYFNAGFLTAIVAVFMAGMYFAGTPSTASVTQQDSVRICELSNLESSVSNYYAEKNMLPADLDTLITAKRVFESDLTDDETDARYSYTPGTGTSFQLCATFELEAKERGEGLWDAAWQHDAGETCFDREVNDWALERAQLKQ